MVGHFLPRLATRRRDRQGGRVLLVLTYTPYLEKISGIVRHHWKEIEKSKMLAKLFPEPPVVAFRPNGLAEWDTLKTVLRMATTG
jgi:hypothetical protein